MSSDALLGTFELSYRSSLAFDDEVLGGFGVEGVVVATEGAISVVGKRCAAGTREGDTKLCAQISRVYPVERDEAGAVRRVRVPGDQEMSVETLAKGILAAMSLPVGGVPTAGVGTRTQTDTMGVANIKYAWEGATLRWSKVGYEKLAEGAVLRSPKQEEVRIVSVNSLQVNGSQVDRLDLEEEVSRDGTAIELPKMTAKTAAHLIRTEGGEPALVPPAAGRWVELWGPVSPAVHRRTADRAWIRQRTYGELVAALFGAEGVQKAEAQEWSHSYLGLVALLRQQPSAVTSAQEDCLAIEARCGVLMQALADAGTFEAQAALRSFLAGLQPDGGQAPSLEQVTAQGRLVELLGTRLAAPPAPETTAWLLSLFDHPAFGTRAVYGVAAHAGRMREAGDAEESERLVDAVMEKYASLSSSRQRVFGLRALSMTQSPRAAAIIVRAASDDDLVMAKAAVQIAPNLSRWDMVSGIRVLVQAQQSRDRVLASSAADALVGLRTAPFKEMLAALSEVAESEPRARGIARQVSLQWVELAEAQEARPQVSASELAEGETG